MNNFQIHNISLVAFSVFMIVIVIMITISIVKYKFVFLNLVSAIVASFLIMIMLLLISLPLFESFETNDSGTPNQNKYSPLPPLKQQKPKLEA
ncbi:MAG: hypothetical protein QG614_361 [Patescibacteria group bacterium]|nr:hypothetical protein [Patescibacteria group bacterium]